MANESGLVAELAALPSDVKALLAAQGFDRDHFVALASTLSRPGDNTVKGVLSAPAADDVQALPASNAERARLAEVGREALRHGRVALVVLAGGMATRMGGVIKALVEAAFGKSFLDLRLAEVDAAARAYGTAPPLWLMTSHSTDAGLRAALGSRLDGDRVATFTQSLSVRLTPSASVFLDANGQPSLYAPGHGDFPDALRQSGLLARFVERGGRVVMLSNVDNLGGTLDPTIIGWHLQHGAPVTAEVVDKVAGDRGGIPVRVDGRPCILEEFRIPPSFDPSTVRVFNSNVFHFDAPALQRLRMPWTYFRVSKNVDGQPVIQFERLVNEVTSVLPTKYLLVPRSGPESRFLPVKDNQELEQRRGEIELALKARGIVG